MSIFSRKTQIAVSSVIYGMGEEPEKIPDVIKASVIGSGLRHASVPVAINRAIIDGMGVKMRQAFSYANHSYYLGIPTGFPNNYGEKEDPILNLLVKEYLERIYSSDTIVVLESYADLGDNYQTRVQELIRAEYFYDFAYEKVITAGGSIQVNAVLVLTGPFIDLAHPNEIGYTLVFTNPDLSTVTINKWYDEDEFDGFDLKTRRIVMVFQRNSEISQRYAYTFGGDDNRLNIFLRRLTTGLSQTFPPVVVKKNNKYINTNAFSGGDWKTSEEYLTSKAYCNRMTLDLDVIIDQVQDNASDSDIDYVFVQPGIRLNSPNQAVKNYLWDYFYRLYLLDPDPAVTKTAWLDWVATNDFDETTLPTTPNKAKNPPGRSVRFHDPEEQATSVDMEIAWRYMEYEEKIGVLATEYETECGPYVPIQSVYLAVIGIFFDEHYEATLWKIRKRLTPSTYAELTICGLRHENYVYKGHSIASGVWAAHNKSSIDEIDPEDPDSNDGTGFILPLDYEIMQGLSPRMQLQLGQECIHIVFNCYVARKQKWYEVMFFQFIIIAVMLVITALSQGATSPYVSALYGAITEGFIAAGLSATVAAAVAALITALIVVAVSKGVSMITEEFGEWAAEKWGAEWGAIAQIAAMIAISWAAGEFFGVPNFSSIGLTQTILQVSQYLLATLATYTKFQADELKSQVRTWEDYAKIPGNPLEEVNKKLEDLLQEFTSVQEAILAPRAEYMDDFLTRTLTTTDGLTNRLFVPINSYAELTLNPRL